MKNKKHEVHQMTNKQLDALLESLAIIVELAKDPEQIKNALERIQSVLKNPSK